MGKSTKRNAAPSPATHASADAQVAPIMAAIGEQTKRMSADGYRVFPAYLLDASDVLGTEFEDVVNFDTLSLRRTVAASTPMCAGHGVGTDRDAYGRVGGIDHTLNGGFMSVGCEVPADGAGAKDRGYISWGSNNQLPNVISQAVATLVYTATAMKFNIDVACGNGLRPMYSYYTTAGGATKEVQIPFLSAGEMLRSRIAAGEAKILAMRKDYLDYYVSSNAADSASIAARDKVLQAIDKAIERLEKEKKKAEDDLKKFEATKKKLTKFLRNTNVTELIHRLFSDLLHFGICFPEVQLSQDGDMKDNNLWMPDIVSIAYRNAQACRLERFDDDGVSRHVYLSNSWLNLAAPADTTATRTAISALPAINPARPYEDLLSTMRQFRLTYRGKKGGNVSDRPTRHILPVAYHTASRVYYPQPAYWSIFRDVYQYAATIIRDRAIRKQNENMFGRIVYVHSEYLERLCNQLDAQKTVEDKDNIKRQEIERIKKFLSNKFNNGQSFAACTFIGSDNKDHDAFRVETIPYNTKNAAEADKTEISDISSIILFALECHPDLIGSSPGGASSSGGTYQREMLLIKQVKMAQTQALLLGVFDLVRDFNGWDEHLRWTIGQKTLTTLDRSSSGIIEE